MGKKTDRVLPHSPCLGDSSRSNAADRMAEQASKMREEAAAAADAAAKMGPLAKKDEQRDSIDATTHCKSPVLERVKRAHVQGCGKAKPER